MLDIETVVSELETLGYFPDQKRSGVNLMVTCPFHNNGRERKPSFGIHLEDGTCNCFTCGWKGNINTLAEELTGKKHYVEQVTKYNKNVKRRNPIYFGGRKKQTIPREEVKYYVRNNRRALTYLESRGIIKTSYFAIGYDRQFDSLVIWVRNLNGDFVYSKRRSLSGKHFYNTEDSDRSDYLFGLFESTKAGAKEVWICESEIDALSLWQFDIPAVAIGSATISEQQVRQLHLAGIRSVRDGLDRDIAGRQGWKLVKELYQGNKVETDWGENKSKDINEALTNKELFSIIENKEVNNGR